MGPFPRFLSVGGKVVGYVPLTKSLSQTWVMRSTWGEIWSDQSLKVSLPVARQISEIKRPSVEKSCRGGQVT
jgi:hypothetical protein